MTITMFHRNPECELCEGCREPEHTVCVPTIRLPTSCEATPSNVPVFFIGQEPGHHEDKEGVPFVDPGKTPYQTAGQMFRRVIAPMYGLQSRSTIYVGNSARCGPYKRTVKERRICTEEYLPRDLETIHSMHGDQPIVIVMLGAEACVATTNLILGEKLNLQKMFKRQATKIRWRGLDLVLFATYHPAYIIRDPNYRHPLIAHIRLISDYLSGTLPTPTEPTIVEPYLP